MNNLINLNSLSKNVSFIPERKKGIIAIKSIRVQKLNIYVILPLKLLYFFIYPTDKTLKIYSIKNITPKKYLQNSKKLL